MEGWNSSIPAWLQPSGGGGKIGASPACREGKRSFNFEGDPEDRPAQDIDQFYKRTLVIFPVIPLQVNLTNRIVSPKTRSQT
jgi:hypothetical protein